MIVTIVIGDDAYNGPWAKAQFNCDRPENGKPDAWAREIISEFRPVFADLARRYLVEAK